jgi:hypothetical protein
MWKKGAEWTFADYILNCRPSKDTEKDWGLETARAAGIRDLKAAIPPTKDLRASWWGIGDQGRTGSCVGWGAADGVLRWHFVLAGRMDEGESVSVRYLWMASKETDQYTERPTTFIEEDGTSLKSALDVARKYGVVTGGVLPFQNPSGSPELYTDGDAATFYAIASRMRIASYFSLGRDPADWRSWLATKGPILTRLDVDAAWDRATEAHGMLKEYDASTARGGHCVCLVGYTPEHFIVRNSWGRAWGDRGFAYALDSYASAAFTEAYGVSL